MKCLRRPVRELLLRALLLLSPLLAVACAAPNVADNQTPYNLALEAWANNELSVAEDHLNTAIEKSEDLFFTAAHLKRGELNLDRARRSAADYGPILNASQQKTWLSKANADFERVLQEEELTNEIRAQTLLLQGQTLRQEGNSEGAIACFDQVLGITASPETDVYRLKTHEALGDILLARVISSVREGAAAPDRVASANLAKAQQHFASGLKIDKTDPDCNRGKGICLFFRELSRQAIHYLEQATANPPDGSSRDYETHFYLARALEDQGGMQLRSLEHYRQAFAADARRSYTPLYRRVVGVLRKYLECEDPRFREFFDQLLSFQGESIDYWTLVEELAESLLSEEGDKTNRLGFYGRSLACARAGNIEDAVADALALAETYTDTKDQQFLNQLMVIFPEEPGRLDYFYGRGKTLFETQHYKELDRLFDGQIKRALATTPDDGEYHALCHMLNGKNIVAQWKANNNAVVDSDDPGSIQESFDREEILSEARNAFQLCLTLPDHHEIRLNLGEVQELLQAFTAAYINYASFAQKDHTHTEAYRRILQLHARDLLPAKKEHVQAWHTLKTYTGEDAEIRTYLRDTAIRLRQISELYCQRCGRKGLDGENRCHECGVFLRATADSRSTAATSPRPATNLRPATETVSE